MCTRNIEMTLPRVSGSLEQSESTGPRSQIMSRSQVTVVQPGAANRARRAPRNVGTG